MVRFVNPEGGVSEPARTAGAAAAVVIHTDGACSGNPGPGGWAAILTSKGKTKELYGGVPQTTNNRMELTAAIRGLEALKRPVSVAIHTDSQYVRQGITEWLPRWKKNGWKTSAKEPVKNADLWQELDHLTQTHKVSWHWVKGHAGHTENERADALARKGCTEAKLAG